MLEEKGGYKMRMMVPKPTDPEKLKKREEISKRLKEYPNEELKKALEWIQKEQEEKVSFIENLDLQTSGEKLWKFSNWKFIFNEGVEKTNLWGKIMKVFKLKIHI